MVLSYSICNPFNPLSASDRSASLLLQKKTKNIYTNKKGSYTMKVLQWYFQRI